MENSIPAGKYKVLSQATLLREFAPVMFVSVTMGKLRRVGEAKADGNPAADDWASVTLETKDGDKILIDGLGLAKQAATDKVIRENCFAPGFKASITGNEITIEKAELKAQFKLGKRNGKYYV